MGTITRESCFATSVAELKRQTCHQASWFSPCKTGDLMKSSFKQYCVTMSPMWQLCVYLLVSQFSIFKYLLVLFVWPPLTLNHCCSGVQCRAALWNISLDNCLHCPLFPRPWLLFSSQVCKSASSFHSCLPTAHFSDLISAGHSLPHTWHQLRSIYPLPKAQLIMFLYCQEASARPSESQLKHGVNLDLCKQLRFLLR